MLCSKHSAWYCNPISFVLRNAFFYIFNVPENGLVVMYNWQYFLFVTRTLMLRLSIGGILNMWAFSCSS